MKCINNLVLIFGKKNMIEIYNKKETEKFIRTKEKYVYLNEGRNN